MALFSTVEEKPAIMENLDKSIIELEIERTEEGSGIKVSIKSDILEDFFIGHSENREELKNGGRVEDYCGVFKNLKTIDGKAIYFPKLKYPINGITGSYDRPLVEGNNMDAVNTFILCAIGIKNGIEIICPGMYTKNTILKIKESLETRARKIYEDYIKTVRVEIKIFAKEIL